MQEQRIDVLLLPVSVTGSATYDSKTLIGETIAANSGLPSITLPIGYDEKTGMPIGAEFIGKEFSEGMLLGMVYAYEQNTPPAQLPKMPEKNRALAHLDLAKYNDLLTRIGYDTYHTILKKCAVDQLARCLTPEKFQWLVRREIHAQ